MKPNLFARTGDIARAGGNGSTRLGEIIAPYKDIMPASRVLQQFCCDECQRIPLLILQTLKVDVNLPVRLGGIGAPK